MPGSRRWHQDKEVSQLIEHLDQPDKYGQWENLNPSEVATILKEYDRCRKDFVYAARNYFWISNKKLGDQLFSLWPSQELILQKIQEIKARGLPQKLIIIKARQLGCSTLIEGLICWRTVFFSNVNALVVSKDINHAAYVLWPIMQFIYDRLPWWIQPMTSMRKAEEGMIFQNPRYEERRHNPGLMSAIHVKGAQSGGVGQGIRLSAVHFSEFCDCDDSVAKEIIDEDMVNALVEDANTFAILESTAKGANRYSHKLWKRCMELGRDAEWFPLFLPWFFEETRKRVVTVDFKLEREEVMMRDRIVNEWVRCDNAPCLQYHPRYVRGEDRSETTCVTCNTGLVHSYILTDEQLHWIQHRRRNAQRDDESLKKLKQEMATTGEAAFQISGVQLFGAKAQEFVNSCIREPLAKGDFDAAGKFHGENTKVPKIMGTHGFYHPCFQEECPLDHSFDRNPLFIWEMPEVGADYCIGADVADGLGGKSDYSVGGVIRYTNSLHANRQVATWRSNEVEPMQFASKLYWLGMFYNAALLAVEMNKFDICIGSLRFNLNYPNMYRWKHIDSVNPLSNKFGWETNMKSRPRLWQTMRAWLNHEMFIIRSGNAFGEMINFVKSDEDALYGGADLEEHDDEFMALMIALFCCSEGQYNEQLGLAMPKNEMSMETAPFHVTCMSCQHKWPEMTISDPIVDMESFHPELDVNGRVSNAGGTRCPVCKSRRISVQRNTANRLIRTDADRLIQEREWSPDLDFDQAEFSEYGLL